MFTPKFIMTDTPLYNYNETNYFEEDCDMEEKIKIFIGLIIFTLLFN